tara:strand:+ start:756 stop:944 length:189 start_codon:yes stop_codon:yes gene_type:complete
MDLQDLRKEDLENQENNLKRTHNIYDQKLKDQQKYYEQALLGTINLSIGIIFSSFLLFKKLI